MPKYTPQAALVMNHSDIDKEEFEEWFLKQSSVVSTTWVIEFLERKHQK